MSRDDLEQMLRSLPLRKPSRRLNERVIRELRGTSTRAARWSGWLSAASAAAAVLALGLSITAVVRTFPSAEQGYRGPAVENRMTDGRPERTGELHEDKLDDRRPQATPAGTAPEPSGDPMPRFRGEALEQPFNQPLDMPREGRFRDLRPGGIAPINPANGEPSQVQ